MADPLLAGTPKLTLAVAFPPTVANEVGAPGTVAGVTDADAPDSPLLPTALVACTVKVYAVPLVSPVTTSAVATELKVTGVWATPAMEGVTT